MLRGTNRSIIEINETENRYFEKILIFVKPEFGTLPAELLSREASRLVGGMDSSPMGLNRNSARRRAAIKRRRKTIALGCAFLFAVAAMILWKVA